MMYWSISECFAQAPDDVRSAVDTELFSRREHRPSSVADLYAALVPSGRSVKITEYLRSVGMDVAVPAYQPLVAVPYTPM